MLWWEKVKLFCERRRLSQRDIESDAGWKLNTLSTAISTKANIRIDKALSLAKAMGVSADWLFDEHQDFYESGQIADAEGHRDLILKSATALLVTMESVSNSRFAQSALLSCVSRIVVTADYVETFTMDHAITLRSAALAACDYAKAISESEDPKPAHQVFQDAARALKDGKRFIYDPPGQVYILGESI